MEGRNKDPLREHLVFTLYCLFKRWYHRSRSGSVIQIRVIGTPEKGLRNIFRGYLSLSLFPSWAGQSQVTEVKNLGCWPEGRVLRGTEEAGGRSGRQPSFPLFCFPSPQAPPATPWPVSICKLPSPGLLHALLHLFSCRVWNAAHPAGPGPGGQEEGSG